MLSLAEFTNLTNTARSLISRDFEQGFRNLMNSPDRTV